MARYYRYCIAFAVFVGLCVASYGVLEGFSQRYKGEFFNLETGRVDIVYVLMTFLMWFSAAFVPSMALGAMITFVLAARRKRIGAQ